MGFPPSKAALQRAPEWLIKNITVKIDEYDLYIVVFHSLPTFLAIVLIPCVSTCSEGVPACPPLLEK